MTTTEVSLRERLAVLNTLPTDDPDLRKERAAIVRKLTLGRAS